MSEHVKEGSMEAREAYRFGRNCLRTAVMHSYTVNGEPLTIEWYLIPSVKKEVHVYIINGYIANIPIRYNPVYINWDAVKEEIDA